MEVNDSIAYAFEGAGELTPTDEGTMHREIGMLTAKVNMILEGSADQRKSRTRAGRRCMDEIVDRVSKVELTTAAVQEEVGEMKPVTDDVKRWKLMGIGGLGVIGIRGDGVGGNVRRSHSAGCDVVFGR